MRYTEQVFAEKDSLEIDGESFSFVREIGEGKSATSFLYAGSGKMVTLKRYRETEQNKIPFEDALDFEILSYERLVQAGVPTPRLIGYNRESYLMVKEYIDGPVMIDWVAAGRITEEIFRMMFAMQSQLKDSGFHVDYYPANFVLRDGVMYCIDYETHLYDEEWDFVNWGVFYWLNREGMARFLKEGDPVLINRPGTYKPYEEPFRKRRDELLDKFGAAIR